MRRRLNMHRKMEVQNLASRVKLYVDCIYFLKFIFSNNAGSITLTQLLIPKVKVNCLECQYLHNPNPVEDKYLCLRDLVEIEHELDEWIVCIDFEEIRSYWKPLYLEN